ncbi:type IV pilus modification PilV family protein [Clostridium tagluense]|uniref:type IV pilus modification PilV family protein n=1 Tax=Clostridium tagluense TaxID=360422 RepID=UPI001C6F16BE|nr:prepilin-type N-terminal cleavage/methylation domain-containing protein [Clostridium tagluense]MBW9155237.1 type II secretion system GspH family protein [Clostridium tagluense]WLC64669.1 type II secretion system GspH family protein [Clostridium tagluense]
MKFKKNKGLTLIEVIISLAILGIIIAPILSMTLTTVKISKSSEDKIFATSLAQQCTEYIKSEDISLLEFSKIGLVENNDNELKKLIKNDNENISEFNLYTLSEKSQYKNIVAKIKYDIKTSAGSIENEYSDISDYDVIINVENNNNVSIRDNQGTTGTILEPSKIDKFQAQSSLKNPVIQIKNTVGSIYCSISQDGSNVSYDNVEIKKNKGSGNVKFILKGESNITLDVIAINEVSTNDILTLDFLKTKDCKYSYSMSSGNSNKIKSNYEVFDSSKKEFNTLIKNYLVEIEIWNYDSKNNTKTLLQKVKTYKVI